MRLHWWCTLTNTLVKTPAFKLCSSAVEFLTHWAIISVIDFLTVIIDLSWGRQFRTLHAFASWLSSGLPHITKEKDAWNANFKPHFVSSFQRDSRDDDSPTSLSSLFQCLTTPSVKKFFLIADWNLSWHNLGPLPQRNTFCFFVSAFHMACQWSWTECLENCEVL